MNQEVPYYCQYCTYISKTLVEFDNHMAHHQIMIIRGKIKKLELSKGLIEMRNEFTGEVNFINDANITELWTKLNETMEKVNEIIEGQVNNQ